MPGLTDWSAFVAANAPDIEAAKQRLIEISQIREPTRKDLFNAMRIVGRLVGRQWLRLIWGMIAPENGAWRVTYVKRTKSERKAELAEDRQKADNAEHDRLVRSVGEAVYRHYLHCGSISQARQAVADGQPPPPLPVGYPFSTGGVSPINPPRAMSLSSVKTYYREWRDSYEVELVGQHLVTTTVGDRRRLRRSPGRPRKGQKD